MWMSLPKFCGVFVAHLISIIPLVNRLLKRHKQCIQINIATSQCHSLFFWYMCFLLLLLSYTAILKVTWKWMSLKIRLPGWWPQISSLNMCNNGWIMSFQRAQTWEAVSYKQLNDDRHMTWCTAYPHTHKNTFVQTHSQHLHQTIWFPL